MVMSQDHIKLIKVIKQFSLFSKNSLALLFYHFAVVDEVFHLPFFPPD